MSNRQVAAIYVAGVLVLLVAFAAGLSIARKSGQKNSLTESGQSAAAQATSEGLQFEVFVEAYGTLAGARQAEAALKSLKYRSAHIKMPPPGETLYKVYIGPYTRIEADRVADEIRKERFTSVLVVEVNRE